MCDLACTRGCMQVEVSLEVVTLEVLTALTVVVDGGATVLPTSMTVDLLPEIRHLVAGHWRVVPRRWACTSLCIDGTRATDGKCDCYANGWRRPSRCGMLMAAMMIWSTS
jgi:hypothetical protein